MLPGSSMTSRESTEMPCALSARTSSAGTGVSRSSRKFVVAGAVGAAEMSPTRPDVVAATSATPTIVPCSVELRSSSPARVSCPEAGNPSFRPTWVTTNSPGALGHRPETRVAMPRVAGSDMSAWSAVVAAGRLPTSTSRCTQETGTSRPPVRPARAVRTCSRVGRSPRPGTGSAGGAATSLPPHRAEASVGSQPGEAMTVEALSLHGMTASELVPQFVTC